MRYIALTVLMALTTAAPVRGPSGKYEGSVKKLGETVNFNGFVHDDTSKFDLTIHASGLKKVDINCPGEDFKMDSKGVVTLPNAGTGGNCIHDALKSNDIQLRGVKYDSAKDTITVSVHAIIINLDIVAHKSKADSVGKYAGGHSQIFVHGNKNLCIGLDGPVKKGTGIVLSESKNCVLWKVRQATDQVGNPDCGISFIFEIYSSGLNATNGGLMWKKNGLCLGADGDGADKAKVGSQLVLSACGPCGQGVSCTGIKWGYDANKVASGDRQLWLPGGPGGHKSFNKHAPIPGNLQCMEAEGSGAGAKILMNNCGNQDSMFDVQGGITNCHGKPHGGGNQSAH